MFRIRPFSVRNPRMVAHSVANREVVLREVVKLSQARID